jgi:hypothetical protein
VVRSTHGKQAGPGSGINTIRPLTTFESEFKMATQEFTPTANAHRQSAVFSAVNAASVVRNAQAARVIFRTVVLAMSAVEDGSMSFDDNGKSSRWSAAISAACSKMKLIRDDLMETSSAPTLDWYTPLNLIEALDAALWFGGCSCPDETQLTNVEAIHAAEVVIHSLDDFLLECDTLGKSEAPQVH